MNNNSSAIHLQPIEVIYNLDVYAMTKSYQDGGFLLCFLNI